MNAVEIEAAVSELAAALYDPAEFPFQFLAAFDKKETTLKRLRKGDSNKSDVPGAVLLINNIHLSTCADGQTREILERLKASTKTASARAKFVFVTDGSYFEAEDVTGAQEPVADFLPNLANHFGFFLPLAGISTVREIKDNPIDVRATGRLNKLYVELLRTNPAWGTSGRRHDMNHFMARLIFCYFAEHTDIFNGFRIFTETIEAMSEGDGSNTHEVMERIFRSMDVKIVNRVAADMPPYANHFPYVNGGLFRGSTETPHFSRIARSYLLQAGKLEWQHINPDIFGSMIQAVADDEERGSLGMHYTSVPNILKVLNPLFLDDLRAQLEVSGDNGRMLLNLRQRMSHIRVFDPACGSGNFLVIAYKHMRSIEAEINRRRGEVMRPTDISERNFRGIEIRDFAAEIARLALVIAKYQCDVQHRGPLAAKAEFLPLKADNWIVCGNALRLDWLEVCPTEGTSVRLLSNDLFQTPLEQPEIDFENKGGEVFICGNPPYSGYNKQSPEQKQDLAFVFANNLRRWGNLDYVSAWLFKATMYMEKSNASVALVMTNTVCQGTQVPVLWPAVIGTRNKISFAHTSFKWSNLAANKAGITVVIVGLQRSRAPGAKLYTSSAPDVFEVRMVDRLNGYLIPAAEVYVSPRPSPEKQLSRMSFGNHPYFGAPLFMSAEDGRQLVVEDPGTAPFLRPIYGSTEIIKGLPRVCIWVKASDASIAATHPALAHRFDQVRQIRTEKQSDSTARALISKPYRFRDTNEAMQSFIAVPQTSSENRDYLPCAVLDARSLVTFKCFAIYDAPLWNMAIIASRLHWNWIGTVCARMRTDFSYSNTLGWNTFPIATLTEQNKADLTRCAEDILLAREVHFPATIANLYDSETMPENLRAAHDVNDEVLERIYIGRRFRNDTERLEKLFEMYTKMTGTPGANAKSAAKRAQRATA